MNDDQIADRVLVLVDVALTAARQGDWDGCMLALVEASRLADQLSQEEAATKRAVNMALRAVKL